MDQMLSWSGSGPPNHVEPLLAVSSSAKWFISLDNLFTAMRRQKKHKFFLWSLECAMCSSSQTRPLRWFYSLHMWKTQWRKQELWWEQILSTWCNQIICYHYHQLLLTYKHLTHICITTTSSAVGWSHLTGIYSCPLKRYGVESARTVVIFSYKMHVEIVQSKDMKQVENKKKAP